MELNLFPAFSIQYFVFIGNIVLFSVITLHILNISVSSVSYIIVAIVQKMDKK